MMHTTEKSDLAIVATKPPSKDGIPAAEGAEPRAGSEGNTDRPRTPRTENRVSVFPEVGRMILVTLLSEA